MTRSPAPRHVSASPTVKRRVLSTLRQVCANLRAMHRDPAVVRAYRDIEALLRREEKRCAVKPRGTPRR